MAYEISVERDYVLVQLSPDTRIDPETLVAMLEEVHTLEAYRVDKEAAIWDFRGALPEMDFDAMLRFKAYVREHYNASWTHHYTAIVADEELLYGLARMYEMISDDVPTETGVFRDLDAAIAWVREKIR